METYSNNCVIKLGRGKGIEILNAIKNAKSSVKIVSPYLSPEYIQELIKLSKKGIDVTLITCDNLEQDSRFSDFKPSDIIKSEKLEDKKLKPLKHKLKIISLILLLISIVSFFVSALIPWIIFIPIILFIATFVTSIISWIIIDTNYKYVYTPIFKLKVFDSKSGINPQSTNLIHSKIFLIDNEILYLGSANFTYSAFRTHYETIIKVMDIRAITDINIEIENIFNSRELKEKRLEEMIRA